VPRRASLQSPVPTALRILEEAEILFSERGYRGTSLGEIADRVGIRGPSLFNHFKNKRALYEAVLDRLMTPFFAMLAELGKGGAGPEAVERILRHHAANPRLACLIQQAVMAGGEQLDWLIEGWYRPFFDSLPDLAEGDSDPSDAGTVGSVTTAEPDASRAATVMAFNSLILGYVSLAPLHERLLGRDPLGPGPLDAYVDRLRTLANLAND
jgi:AcrR family transcriptional regulator